MLVLSIVKNGYYNYNNYYNNNFQKNHCSINSFSIYHQRLITHTSAILLFYFSTFVTTVTNKESGYFRSRSPGI